jgi:excisionase family DNA binding protein
MAGKFVSIEEAARLLGVSVEEVNRLVDRKKLFPMRDGAVLKFKVDEIERVAAALGDESSQSESLALDLDLPTPGMDDGAIDLGDEGPSGTDAGSQTVVRGGRGGSIAASGLSALDLGGDDTATGDSDDLALESIIGASSPSLPRTAPGSDALAGADVPLTLDLSDVAAGGSVALPGSQATGAVGGLSAPARPGSGFSAPVDSGLSLEDGGIAVSGIDLDTGAAAGSGVSDAGGSLVGEAFELGAGGGDEDSASVVIATEESGDSSFFNAAVEDSASVNFGDSSAIDGGSSSLMVDTLQEPSVEMGFSGWQIAGLCCCALLLLAGAFVMYDLAWTIRTPQGTPVSAPLLNALADTFGWRR